MTPQDGSERGGGDDRPRLRQLRKQGFRDGRAGRRRRWPNDVVYLSAYQRGREARGR